MSRATRRNSSSAIERRLRDGRAIILLIDEMERLAGKGFDPRWGSMLRALSQDPHFAFCAASQRPLGDIFPLQKDSPLDNVPTVKRLGAFTPDEARAFLHQRLRGTGVDFNDDEIVQLLAESACHPAQLQWVAREMFERYGQDA